MYLLVVSEWPMLGQTFQQGLQQYAGCLISINQVLEAFFGIPESVNDGHASGRRTRVDSYHQGSNPGISENGEYGGVSQRN